MRAGYFSTSETRLERVCLPVRLPHSVEEQSSNQKGELHLVVVLFRLPFVC